MMDMVNRRRILQINRDNPLALNLVFNPEIAHLAQLLPADLTPTPRRPTEIDDSLDPREDVIDFLNLQ